MMTGQLPQLSYSQLFSFQVAHNLVEAQQASERYRVNFQAFRDLIKNPNLPGQHVRYVTSLMGASVRTLEGMAFQVLVPGTKTLTFIPDKLDEMTGWIGALERSVEIAQQLLAGGTYEQLDEIPNNIFASMNPATMAGMMPGPSGAGGGFIQSSTHALGAYNNPQDSMALQQRIMSGATGSMFQQAQEVRPPFGITTPLSNSTPFGVTAPYPGNFQPNLGQGNLQNPMGGVNFQTPGGMLQQGGPFTSMPRQAGFMGQSSAGATTSYNKPQGNFNTQNQLNPGMLGTSQGSQQGWDQGEQDSNALVGEAGVRRIRRATRTLRDFNNTMDQFLAQPSTSGYGGGVSQTQNPGSGWGNPQAQFQGYDTPQQAQVPWYGRGGLQGQVRQSQVPGFSRGAPQVQAQWYGRGAPQAQGQGYGGAQQGRVQGYGGGAPQGQMQNYGAAQQAPVYGRGAPQIQNPGYGRAVSMMQNPGYGRAGSMMQNPGYARASSIMPQPQYRGAAPGVASDANAGDWKQFTSPDGRQ